VPRADLEHRMLAVATTLRRRIRVSVVPVEPVAWRRPAGMTAPSAGVPVMDPWPGVPVMDPDVAAVNAAGQSGPPLGVGRVPQGALDDTGPGRSSGATRPAATSDAAAEVEAVAPRTTVEADDPVPAMAKAPLASAATAPSMRKPPVIEDVQDLVVERARSTRAQRIGDEGERLAALRLEELGWRIVARNVRLGRAEVDLLAIDPSAPPTLVVVEVRRRSRRDFGLAEETVDGRKRALLRRAAAELEARPVLPDGTWLPALPVRIDLIAIDRGPDGRPSVRHHIGLEG